MAVGKLGYPDLAEKAIRDGMCDLVMLGRPLLADPDWCRKAYAGEVERIRPCIGCQEGCINEFVEGGHPQCAVNPRTGFEDVIPETLPRAENTKKIAVVGAGPSGMQFALTASARGHQVTLIEREKILGGKVVPGSRPKIKFDFKNYLEYLIREVHLAEEKGGLTVCTGVEADTQWLKEQNFDAIVYNIGTTSVVPKIPGVDQADWVQATDLLCEPEKLGKAKKTVVIGGGVVGCETAYWLKYEKGCDVTVVEMLPYIMSGACTANRYHLIHYMEKAGVQLLNCAKVTGFTKGSVQIEKNISKGVPDPYNTWQPQLPENIANPLAKKIGPETENQELPADLVIFAMGGRPDESLYLEGLRLHAAKELYNIGDSFSGGRVLEASRAAYRLARGI